MTADPYRRIAGVYDRVIEPMQSGVRGVAVRLLPPEPDWSVLDVGCGTGTWLVPYLEAGCTVSGIDVSPAMLEHALARLGDGADLRLTTGNALPFDNESFDLTITSMVLHEVTAKDRAPFINEMARVTKPDGQLLLIDFRFGSLRGWKGPTLRGVSSVIERFSGHYSGYRSFKATGGLPPIIKEVGLNVSQEKIVAGGNMAIFVVSPVARHQ